MLSGEGGASGGGAAGFDGILKYTKDRFIQECAISLFANTHFGDGANVARAASEAVNRAKILASQLTFTE